MKQWFAAHILSEEDFGMEEPLPFSNKEFAVLLGMVGFALALFGVIVRVMGA